MKLTNEKRDSITSQVVERMFAEKEKAHTEKGKQIALEAVQQSFDNSLVKTFPPGYLPETKSVNIYFPGNHSFHVYLDEAFRHPYDMNRKWSDGIEIPLDKLTKSTEKKVSNHIYEGQHLADARKQARSEIKSILYSVNTSNQLKELWPDLFEFVMIEGETKKPNNQLAPLVSKYTKQLKAS